MHLEKALEEYWVADKECRALCEGPYDYEGYNYMEYSADLFQSIVGELVQNLCCEGQEEIFGEGSHYHQMDEPLVGRAVGGLH